MGTDQGSLGVVLYSLQANKAYASPPSYGCAKTKGNTKFTPCSP